MSAAEVTICRVGRCAEPVHPDHDPCCSSHGDPLCCEHYRRFHFVETACGHAVPDSVEDRVQRGIAFLEEKVGAAWKALINVKSLDLGSPYYCVLGQIFADKVDEHEGPPSGFSWAYERYLDSSVVKAGALGFEAGADTGYDGLQAAWERALAEPSNGGDQ